MCSSKYCCLCYTLPEGSLTLATLGIISSSAIFILSAIDASTSLSWFSYVASLFALFSYLILLIGVKARASAFVLIYLVLRFIYVCMEGSAMVLLIVDSSGKDVVGMGQLAYVVGGGNVGYVMVGVLGSIVEMEEYVFVILCGLVMLLDVYFFGVVLAFYWQVRMEGKKKKNVAEITAVRAV